jgi:transcriptional regulator with XRE-family HTH domain
MRPSVHDQQAQDVEQAVDQVKGRVARRVREAMARQGYPSAGSDARRALAESTGWDLTVITNLLSGAVLPSMKQLIVLSQALQRPLTYWLDINEPPLPPDTRRAHALAGGEDIVLRLQDGQVPASTEGMPLVHFRAHEAMSFGIEGGDSVVATAAIPKQGPRLGYLYLFCADDAYFLRVCVEANQRGVFRSIDGADTPFISRGASAGSGFSCGEVVAVVRAGEALHAHCYEQWQAANPQLQRVKR